MLHGQSGGGNASIFCPLAAPRVDGPGVATVPKSPEIRSTSSAALTTLRQARASLRSTPGKRNHRIVTPSARSTPEHNHHILAAVATELESSLPSPGKQPTVSSPSKLSFPQVIRSAVKRKLMQANESHPNPLKNQICHLRYRVPPRSPPPSRPVIRLRPTFDSSFKVPRRPPRPAEGDLFSFDSTTTTVFGDQFFASGPYSGASSLQASCDGSVEDRAICEQMTAQIEFPEFTQSLLSVPEASEGSTSSSGSQATLSTGTTSWDRIPNDLSSFTCDTAPLASRFSFSDSSDLSSGTISHAKEYRSALLYRKVKGPSNVTTSFQQTLGTHQVNSVGDSLSSTFESSAAALILEGAKNPSPDSDRVFRLTTLLTDEDLFMEPARHTAP
ncbi:BZ3501_MvSof-1269-A2-R1_Chr1-3g01742 [Microbotryum saponariae]|nr:BZ3501_MvSof-1269-A2-R1_Chr1-3g01742 [Microbotryum saponariae]